MFSPRPGLIFMLKTEKHEVQQIKEDRYTNEPGTAPEPQKYEATDDRELDREAEVLSDIIIGDTETM